MESVAASAIPRGQVDLVDFVDWSGVECLNQSTSHSLINAVKQGYRDDDGLHLESDADEQLLIYIPFAQVIKLHSIVIKGPEEEGPKMVKLFTNKEHMGFSNVSDYPPSDSIALTPENLKGKAVNLKYVKFQSVRSLTIFIEDNQGGNDISKVQKIVLYGTTRFAVYRGRFHDSYRHSLIRGDNKCAWPLFYYSPNFHIQPVINGPTFFSHIKEKMLLSFLGYGRSLPISARCRNIE